VTTIAYRDGVMAADALTCQGDALVGTAKKIVRNAHGDLAGCAGAAVVTRAFLAWFLGGEQGRFSADGAARGDLRFRGLIVRARGRIQVFEDEGWYTFCAPYVAIGSGAPEARGAMFSGADAITAVRAARAHDAGTGGRITVLRSTPPAHRVRNRVKLKVVA
jgi:hypothetical protein